MSRSARLVYIANPSLDETPIDVLSTSDDGIPLGWMFCFGGRNFWEPDEKVEQRGGTSAQRSRYITPLEVADARLHNAMQSVRGSEHMWVWFASLELLRRRMISKGKKGFIRLEAPWLFKGKGDTERTNQAPAYAENYVNYLAADRLAQIGAAAKPLEETVTFIPLLEESDVKRFRKLKLYPALSEPARAAAVIIGIAGSDASTFEQNVRANYQPEFEKINSLPPYPKPPKAATPKPVTQPVATTTTQHGSMKISKAEPEGLVSKIKSLFGRR